MKSLFLCLSLVSVSAFASTEVSLATSNCHLAGTIHLKSSDPIVCTSDLLIEDGTQIVTHGFRLGIFVVGNFKFSNASPKISKNIPQPRWEIVAFDKDSAKDPQNDGAAADITIKGRTAVGGHLHINNHGAVSPDMSGPVSLDFTSVTPDYSQSIETADGTAVDMVVDGDPVNFVGADHELPGQLNFK